MKCVRIKCGREVKKDPTITNGMYFCESCKAEDKAANKINAKIFGNFTERTLVEILGKDVRLK